MLKKVLLFAFCLLNTILLLSCSSEKAMNVQDNTKTSIQNTTNKIKTSKVETQDCGAQNFWSNTVDNNASDLNLIIEWCKRNEKFEYIGIIPNGVELEPYLEPYNKKTRKSFFKNKDHKTVIDILSKLNIGVINSWKDRKEITFLYRFNQNKLKGNFCLKYTNKKLTESEGYKKVAKNLYSSVIFYE